MEEKENRNQNVSVRICRLCEKEILLENMCKHSKLCLSVMQAREQFKQANLKLKYVLQSLAHLSAQEASSLKDYVNRILEMSIENAKEENLLKLQSMHDELSPLNSNFTVDNLIRITREVCILKCNVYVKILREMDTLDILANQQENYCKLTIKSFNVIKPISRGAFGIVYLVQKKNTMDYYALKVIKKSAIVSRKKMQMEKEIMSSIYSSFVVQLFYSFQSRTKLYLVMEYLPGGDLYSLLRNVGSLPENDACKYAADIVLALECLHSKGILHRDLKPDNLLISLCGHLKLTDFGLSVLGLEKKVKSVVKASFLSTIKRSTSIDISTTNLSPNANEISSLKSVRKIRFSPYSQFRQNSCTTAPKKSSMKVPQTNVLVSPVPKTTLKFLESVKECNESKVDSEFLLSPLHTLPEEISSKKTNVTLRSRIKIFSCVGSPEYLAPEVLLEKGYSFEADIWSFGIILHEILVGTPPFIGNIKNDIFNRVVHEEIDWSSAIYSRLGNNSIDLLKRLLNKNPEDRISINEIKTHPYFQLIKWEEHSNIPGNFEPILDSPEDISYFDARNDNYAVSDCDRQLYSSARKSTVLSPCTPSKSPAPCDLLNFSFTSYPLLHDMNLRSSVSL